MRPVALAALLLAACDGGPELGTYRYLTSNNTFQLVPTGDGDVVIGRGFGDSYVLAHALVRDGDRLVVRDPTDMITLDREGGGQGPGGCKYERVDLEIRCQADDHDIIEIRGGEASVSKFDPTGCHESGLADVPQPAADLLVVARFVEPL